jgi:hypothetical protein
LLRCFNSEGQILSASFLLVKVARQNRRCLPLLPANIGLLFFPCGTDLKDDSSVVIDLPLSEIFYPNESLILTGSVCLVKGYFGGKTKLLFSFFRLIFQRNSLAEIGYSFVIDLSLRDEIFFCFSQRG